MKRVGASAPGKALLCGEYAVLERAPAVVAAVDRRVSVAWSEERQPMPPEVESALELAQARCGRVPGSLELDVSALQRDGVKLGLGSSAAGAAAAAAAVFASHGHDLTDRTVIRSVFECAFEGHAAVAPSGSGVDVAASTFGGFARFQRTESGPGARAVAAPPGLCIRLVWTGHAARTSELVAKVHGLGRDDPRAYRRRMDELAEVALAFADAFGSGNVAETVAAAALYGDAMQALGEASGAPIVDARLELAGRLALRFSGSAKPSGAGGGDVAVAFFADSENADAFVLACKDEGFHPIDVSWGEPGVRAC